LNAPQKSTQTGPESRPDTGYRRDFRVLSTLPSSHAPQPSWKQEVNRRIAEHKNRKGLSVVNPNAQAEESSGATSRAATAAARVAERYAKAPSYYEMQEAAEARNALRAAEAATRAALEAQAAAQAAVRNLEASEIVREREEQPELAYKAKPSERQTREPAKSELTISETHPAMEIRWEADMPMRTAAEQARYESQSEHRGDTQGYASSAAAEYFEHVEAAQPIHANLIEFPREIIATRRMRPRLAEFNGGTESSQLSIFEVDPSTISIDPAMPEVALAGVADSWAGEEWSAIRLDEQPGEEPEYRYEAAKPATKLYQAPLGARMMATMVDLALVLVMVCSIAGLAALELSSLPSTKTSEITGLLALILVGVLYEGLFLLYAKCTPGMRYAQISLCTFDDERPTREQMRGRLIAMTLSLLPMGLGLVWAIFDEDNMSWHDRHSQTYLRQG
jgi:uncharacterized RDD family membrane protein YckC